MSYCISGKRPSVCNAVPWHIAARTPARCWVCSVGALLGLCQAGQARPGHPAATAAMVMLLLVLYFIARCGRETRQGAPSAGSEGTKIMRENRERGDGWRYFVVSCSLLA